MSKFYTVVSQKRQTQFFFRALLAATLLPQLLMPTAQAALETTAQASNSVSTRNAMIEPDTSIFSGCEFENLKIPTSETSSKSATDAFDWVNRNSYEFNKRNMTVAKAKEVEEKIKTQGERSFMMNRMNDPEMKKNYLEQVAIQLETSKLQDAVYKCLQANIMKNSPEDLKRVRSQDSHRATDAIPIKAIAIQMALNNRISELLSDVSNYAKNCFEKEPKDLAIIDNQPCQQRYQRSMKAQTLLVPYSQMRADVDTFSADENAFQKTLKYYDDYEAGLKNQLANTSDTGGASAAVRRTSVN